MSRILGLDLGTNSIGWAIVDENSDGTYTLFDKGVSIFQEGVKIEKGVESSKAAERTLHRSTRRRYFRRRLRKIELLKVLIQNDMCPSLTDEQLNNWRFKKEYPLVDDFLLWQRTDDNENKNPYHDRYICLTQKLDLRNKKNRYILGRALYHLSQRRGFLSNRLDNTKESDGSVKQGIEELSKAIAQSECNFLGEYFYKIYGQEKIRNRYTARGEYEKEFERICSKQDLPEVLREQLYKAIFFQRPLKSQKGVVGRCKFEKNKSRVPISHPRFEEFRMLSFINNIKVKTSSDKTSRPLSKEEKEKIIPLFFRKSKRSFIFEDIAKSFTSKGSYAFEKDDASEYKPFVFNYPMFTSVSGCPVISSLRDIFGNDWETYLIKNYKLKDNKSNEDIINDIWHVLFFFNNEEKIKKWAIDNLNLDSFSAEEFSKIPVSQGYASLSLNAINKILPYLRKGSIYPHAVFMANMTKILPKEIWGVETNRNIIEKELMKLIEDNRSIEGRIEQRLRDFIIDNFDINLAKLERLYHPSQIDVFEKVPNSTPPFLGSPRTSSVRNPMAMRALFRLRALINTLLKDGEIDRNTVVHIEFARELNDANKRKAIEQYQREREKENCEYRKKIKEIFSKSGITTEPTDTDIIKYRLWEEQGHVCLYTGEQICVEDFLGANPKYDIEHTIPRSIGGKDALVNKTLCRCDFNRQIKRNKLPSELPNIENVRVIINERTIYSSDKIKELEKNLEKNKSTGYVSKEVKDNIIQKRRKMELELQYLREKNKSFYITEIKDGYRKNQDIDNSVISKYGREYLKTLFYKVYTIKGLTTSEYRKMWGIQENKKKDRSKFSNHTIDAIVVACIGVKEYQKLANYYNNYDKYSWDGIEKPKFDKPWKTFTEDLLRIDKEILVSHYTPDNTIKQTKKKLRKRGIIQKTESGDVKYMMGDSARSQLHLDTFYGCIKKNNEYKYVVRKSLSSLEEKDIPNIVDDVVREKVKQAIKDYGKEALSGGRVWMNIEKGIEIKKVRIFVPTVKEPINLKKHRDLSQFDHKREYYVANDSNYCMAIYEGLKKGNMVRDYEIIKALEAVTIAKNDPSHKLIIPPTKDGLVLTSLYKTGTLVIIYDNDPAEVREYDYQELSSRMYKIAAMSKDGRVKIKHHMESRIDKEINEDYFLENGKSAPKLLTVGFSMFDPNNYQPFLLLSKKSQNFLVEHHDFEISPSGKIIFLTRQNYD